jgi:hypothetical protein
VKNKECKIPANLNVIVGYVIVVLIPSPIRNVKIKIYKYKSPISLVPLLIWKVVLTPRKDHRFNLRTNDRREIVDLKHRA